jgi:hypothetical protein
MSTPSEKGFATRQFAVKGWRYSIFAETLEDILTEPANPAVKVENLFLQKAGIRFSKNRVKPAIQQGPWFWPAKA